MDYSSKKKILLIYGDPNHRSGYPYKTTLENIGYDVTLEETRGAFRMPDMLTRLVKRTQPDIVIAGSHLDPRYASLLEKEGKPVILLSTRSETELAKDKRIKAWRSSPVLKGIINNDSHHQAIEGIVKTLAEPQSDGQNRINKPTKGMEF